MRKDRRVTCLRRAAALTLAALQHGYSGGSRQESNEAKTSRFRWPLRCYSDCLSEPHESQPMNGLLSSYLPIVIFIGVALAVGLALIAAPFLIAYKSPDPEKLSAYECGFNAFDDARMKFDVRFYLVSILFIIFDLEVAFLFPWSVSFHEIGMLGFWSMMVFLAVLTIGFIYEWKKGALEWD
jgi:NADH-quinone oxidoreductase subunit A